MAVVFAMLFGLAAGVVAFFCGALLASVLAAALHMSRMEGGPGYFAAAVGALTGIAGMLGAMVLTLRRHGVTSAAGMLGGTAGAFAGLAIVAAACFGLYYMSVPHYIHASGPPVYLNFQIATPPGVEPDLATWSTELHTDRNHIAGYWKDGERPQLDGRTLAVGRVEMHFRTRHRELVLYLPDQERHSFPILLPADPTGSQFRRWSEWQDVDRTGYRIRYMISVG